MKKVINGIILIFSIFMLGACSNTNIQEELQKNQWNVVSTNGESYIADFGQDTVSFDLTITKLGFSYSINEENNTFTMTQQGKDKEPQVFNITKNEDEYIFKSDNEETKEQYGDLTLRPIEKESNQ